MHSPSPTSSPLLLSWAEINLKALESNIEYLKTQAQAPFFIMVIKANAYGHGMLELATELDDNQTVNAFAVARIEEALQLRAAGISKRIIVLSGVISSADLSLCAAHQLEAVIHNPITAQHWCQTLHENTASQAACHIWLKVNTGMNRLGLNQEQFTQVENTILQAPNALTCDKLCGIMSHFSSSEDVTNQQNAQQKSVFNFFIHSALLQHFPSAKLCLSNSGGILYHPDSHHNAVRSGISCYGLPPGNDEQLAQHLQPVMRLKSRIIAIHALNTGDSAGYNEQFIAQKPSTLATVAIGYGDGYPRAVTNGTAVYVNGETAAIAGRVSMDLISIDISGLSHVAIGDEVELWGEHISCDTLAKQCQTISYELVTRVSQRVKRVLIK